MPSSLLLKSVSVTPVVQAAAYATGDVLGGKMTFAGLCVDARNCYLNGIRISSKGCLIAVPIDVFIFRDNPNDAGSTFVENGAIALGNPDLVKLMGVVSMLAANFVASSAAKASGFINPRIPLVGLASSSLYACLVSRGAGPTPAAVDDIVVELIVGNLAG